LNTAEVAQLLSQGRAGEALALAKRGVESHASDGEWRHMLAASLHANGMRQDAVRELRESVRLAPTNALAWNTLGAILVDMGDPLEGEKALEQALRLDPENVPGRFNLGLAYRNRGDHVRARAEFERILARWPDEASSRFELAGVLLAQGAAADAVPHLEQLLKKFPDQPQALAHLAQARAQLGDAAGAASLCDRILALPKVPAGSVASAAYTLASTGRVADAVAAARRAITMAPNSIDVRSVAAGAVAHAGYSAEALPHFAAIAANRPRVASSWMKLGTAALAAGDTRQAIEAFRRQLDLTPGDRTTLISLGSALNDDPTRDQAIAAFAQALDAGHRDAGILAALVHAKGMDCDWEGLEVLEWELCEKALVPSRHPAQPQPSLYLDTTPAEQRTWAENWARVEHPSFAPLFEKPEARAGRRLRVGYLSADFYNHATALLMAGMFDHHDRAHFEVFAYSTAENDGSPMRARLAASIEHFVDIVNLPAHLAARRIAADRLDVLVDLGGYVRNSAIGLLALRPAPVQGHFLGYPGTTGAAFVDFLVADPFVIPAGQEASYTERVLRMPACYQPNDPTREDPPAAPRSAHGLKDDALALCSFNQGVKIRPAVFTQWCALLEALPSAVLWLSDNGERARKHLARAAAARGIDPARLVFAPHMPQREHVARLKAADIALDTFPYNSHTTASDAVWAGVPLVTTRGDTFASRVAGSVLRAAGCGDWVFDDASRAFEATLALARDGDLRAKARSRFASARASALFDAAAFTRAFESLLEEAVAAGPK
jgi:predicted O-linked N-acetylglucosamine transferase (SPINDLY family)